MPVTSVAIEPVNPVFLLNFMYGTNQNIFEAKQRK